MAGRPKQMLLALGRKKGETGPPPTQCTLKLQRTPRSSQPLGIARWFPSWCSLERKGKPEGRRDVREKTSAERDRVFRGSTADPRAMEEGLRDAADARSGAGVL